MSDSPVGRRLRLSDLRAAQPFPIEPATVAGCLDLKKSDDDNLFHRTWTRVLAGESYRVPPRIAPVTGHVAESVAAVKLADVGFTLFWQLTGPGRHGVDLLMLDPAGATAVAWEVKGTLRRNGFPRLSRRDVEQMSPDWLDRHDGMGMSEWGLNAADVLGGFVVLSFARMLMWVGVTSDYASITPIRAEEELLDLSWAWHD